MTTQEIVSKLWNLCNVLRDDGITYHQYVTELTYILFLKMAKETGAEKQIPEAYRWDKLTAKSGIELKKFYKELLTHLGDNCTGRVREIYQGSATNIEEPKNLEKIITTIDGLDWYSAREEGLGNLKGCRAIVAKYGSRMDALITFDGFRLDKITNQAVGSHRYRVTVKTEGGHSFGAFGNRNAIAVLSSMISTLYSVKVPQEGNSKTTYNVGIIEGGTSVNTIAQCATMLCEYRSDNVDCLETMRQEFEQIFKDNLGILVTAALGLPS